MEFNQLRAFSQDIKQFLSTDGFPQQLLTDQAVIN